MPEGVAAVGPPQEAQEVATAGPPREGEAAAITTLELSSLQDLVAPTTTDMETSAPTDVQFMADVVHMTSAG